MSEYGMLSPLTHVMRACLDAVGVILRMQAARHVMDTIRHVTFVTRLWMVAHVADAECAAAAGALWARYSLELPPGIVAELIVMLKHDAENVRGMAARAIAGAVALRPAAAAGPACDALYAFFARFDEGIPRTLVCAPHCRAGVCAALSACGARSALAPDAVLGVLRFLLARGFADTEPRVRAAALEAGIAFVESYAASHTQLLLPVFEVRALRGVAGCGSEL